MPAEKLRQVIYAYADCVLWMDRMVEKYDDPVFQTCDGREGVEWYRNGCHFVKSNLIRRPWTPRKPNNRHSAVFPTHGW